ncbi:zinc-nutrition responsive transporter [Volvox carteri f. nagariensis]|uniref:Zinc-nutrition responsive transporter n=1 Tax=Volvox carteri f. nagariensis TaxID=3068 RepID=D8TH90_VOLCA|nr:zinc-nutrition responsive transporter [Volvox carteri f. nagariensis]EFJ52669.1 zinc-nutrition responsive transporter [Volvox carteri f. nagariensis]|eukprot:XP_002945674.1 zinc-nutrition responsive transporter [Volvox carteri f. nagariensis]
MYPFTRMLSDMGVEQEDVQPAVASFAMMGSNAKARSLLQAALQLKLCSVHGNTGPDACQALFFNSSDGDPIPAGNSSTAGDIVACEWRQQQTLPAGSSTSLALLSKLLITSNSSTTSSQPDGLCLPVNLESVLGPYLTLIAPDRCGDFITVETCSENPRCRFDDHTSYSHCMVDFLSPAKLLAVSEDVVTTAPLPVAALAAEHLCNPESYWEDSHSDRPVTLSQEECTAQGSFSLGLDALKKLAAAAKIPVSLPASSPPSPTFPETLPESPHVASGEDGHSIDADHDGHEHDALGDLEGNDAREGGPASLSSPASSQGDNSITVSAPSCQLDIRGMCVPTLLAFASSAVNAAANAVETYPQLNASSYDHLLSDAARTLLVMALGTAKCILANSSATACSLAVLASRPDGAAAFADVFSPNCSRLSTEQCGKRLGCALVAHGDHSDCKRTSTYAADYLLPSRHSPLPQPSEQHAAAAAASAAAIAEAAQRLANSCRAVLSPSCGQQQINVTVTQGMLAALALPAGVRGVATNGTTDSGNGRELDGALSGGTDGKIIVDSPEAAADVGDDHSNGTTGQGHDGDDSRSLKLRIGAIFAVLVAGLTGCVIPILMRGRLERAPLVSACLRALSAGLILCLALVHIATHAVSEMDGLIESISEESSDSHDGHDHRRHRRQLLLLGIGHAAPLHRLRGPLYRQASNRHLLHRFILEDVLTADDYGSGSHDHYEQDDHSRRGGHDHNFPIGMCTVVFGYLLMVAVEHLSHAFLDRHARGPAGVAPAANNDGVDRDEQPKLAAGTARSMSQRFTPTCTTAVCGGAKGPESAVVTSVEVIKQPSSTPAAISCCRAASTPRSATSSAVETLLLAGMAIAFEFGCVFHSFIIGLTLGANTNFREVRTLAVALVFHQFLEGIGLGSVLMSAELGHWRVLCMTAMYAVTCPVGIGAGIAIADGYDSHSITARAIQGTLNGVSAGLLLHLASALISYDFGSSTRTRWRPLQRLLLFTALASGAALFAVLALWA